MEKQSQLVCEKHQFSKNNLQFLCLNKDLPDGLSRLLCQYCLEDSNFQNLVLASIDGLKINTKILNQWPPLHQQINLRKIQQKHLNLDQEQIVEFYDNLKSQICEVIEIKKKLDIKLYDEISNNQDFVQKYYEISEFSQYSNIIENPDLSVQQVEQQLEEMIKLKYTQKDKNQLFINSLCEKNLYDVVDQRELIRIKEDILNKLQSFSYFQKFQQSEIVQNMISCNYAESQQIKIEKNNGRISLIPSRNLSGQVYSEQPINQDLIYEFIINFKQKPTNYVCIGFEEESFRNRYLGSYGRNSFIFGQTNDLFCYDLVKGTTNLQSVCQDEFVENVIIQAQLKENKFYISDYPQKRSVNRMNSNQYQFKSNQQYFLTIQIYDQSTQIEIVSSRIISNFTII